MGGAWCLLRHRLYFCERTAIARAGRTRPKEATTMSKARRAPREWGAIRKLPSGRFQASYLDAALTRRNAPARFTTRTDADAWLTAQRAALDAGTWRDPASGAETFAAYAARWLDDERLKPRTRYDYGRILDRLLLPEFGQMPLKAITPAAVRAWYKRLNPATPVMRAHAYGLLRAMLRTAVADDLIAVSPCRIRGAGQARPTRRTRPATLAELEVIETAMPDRLRLMVMLAAWCALRFGELAELRRADVDLIHGVLWVRRGVVRAGGQVITGTPKSPAGVRDVTIPPDLMPMVHDHLAGHPGPEPDALLFTNLSGRHLTPGGLYDHYYPARDAAGRPDLRFHDLRHTGATLAAAAGATIAELMHRLGHSTAHAAMLYQHATADRDAAIAEALSEFRQAKVVALRPSRQRRDA
jgi:integrase